ncbi:cysteine protease [Umbelopsis sp. WA50703]
MQIIVDDLLPVSRDGTLMCTFSTNHEELWAPIIEKAYMKLMGGYDFPGSNSGIDLYTLTGWIPEHIFVEDKDFVANNVWERLMGGQKYGDVLVTISTGEMSEETAAERGLVPTHAYAVIDIREVNGVRFMQVKNPWSHLRWKGPYSHIDEERWSPELTKALNYDPSLAMEYDDGIFWIDFDSVCENFVSIHLNWNPELFMYRWALHIPWHGDIGPKKDTYNLGYNPQFKLVVNVPENKTSAVWLLMSKHIMVTEQKNVDFITLHVYNDTNGERVYHHGKAFKEGTYVNSPHILVRFNAPAGTSTYTLVFSQHEKLKTLYFSLKVFSFSPFQLTEVPQTYPIENKISGKWTEQTSGGNASNASFMNNPQWKLSIMPPESAETTKCGVIITLEAPKNFALLPVSFSAREVVSQTDSYQHGFCCCELHDIKPGDYTIIASTYEPGLIGNFLLTVCSNTQYAIDSIPAEGAGMFRKVINSEWIVGYNAMGCSTYRNYHRNPRYLLEIRELTTVRVRLQTDGIDPIPPTNITIYEKHPSSIFGREVATSGPYTNVIQVHDSRKIVHSEVA